MPPTIHPPRDEPCAPQERWQDAVTRRVRGLLRTDPLHAAERTKGARGVDLSTVDLRVLSLRVLDAVIEEMGLGRGAARDEVTGILLKMLERTSPTLTRAETQLVADITIDALLNDTNRRQAFSAPYVDWSAEAPVRRELSWHLLREVELADGSFVLQATTEGINVYTGMLEYEVEDAQVAEEAVLHAQVKRGRIRDAVRTAQNARLRSIEYETVLQRVLRLVERDVSQVSWQADLGELLDRARDHLTERLESERQLVDMASGRVDDASDEDAPRLAELIDILEECLGRHIKLHRGIIQASEVFLREQERQYFRPRAVLRLPDLEAEVVSRALELPAGRFDAHVDDLLRSYFPGAARPLVYVPQLVDRLLSPARAGAPTSDELEEVLLDELEEAPFFDAADERAVAATLVDLPDEGATLTDLLAELRGFDARARAESLLVLTVLRAFEDAAEAAQGARPQRTSAAIDDAGFIGDELLVTPSGETRR